MKKMITEALGTFFFTLAFLMSRQSDWAPLVSGLTLAGFSLSEGYHSEGYFNPAVAFAMRLRGRIEVSEFFRYTVVQIIAALAAASLSVALLRCTHSGEIVPHKNELFCSLIAEFLGVFALVWVVLYVTRATEKAVAQAPWAVGLTTAAMMFALRNVSGGVLNPALAMGMALSGVLGWADVWLYWLSAGLAAAAAASVYQVFFGWEG